MKSRAMVFKKIISATHTLQTKYLKFTEIKATVTVITDCTLNGGLRM